MKLKKVTVTAVFFIFVAISVFSSMSIAGKKQAAFIMKTGNLVPGDTIFLDEYGNPVTLGSYFSKPLLLSFIYFNCRGICPKLLAGIADVLANVKSLKAGKDFYSITISFDPEDTPDKALKIKKNFLRTSKGKIPENGWHFLTSHDETRIKRVTEAAGFKYFKDEQGMFVHPAGVVVVAPGGKIVRYLYGVDFLPLDLQLAILEASEGRVSSPISRILLYCFSYDPKGRKYTLNILRIAGTGVIFSLLLFAVFVLGKGKKHDKKGDS